MSRKNGKELICYDKELTNNMYAVSVIFYVAHLLWHGALTSIKYSLHSVPNWLYHLCIRLQQHLGVFSHWLRIWLFLCFCCLLCWLVYRVNIFAFTAGIGLF